MMSLDRLSCTTALGRSSLTAAETARSRQMRDSRATPRTYTVRNVTRGPIFAARCRNVADAANVSAVCAAASAAARASVSWRRFSSWGSRQPATAPRGAPNWAATKFESVWRGGRLPSRAAADRAVAAPAAPADISAALEFPGGRWSATAGKRFSGAGGGRRSHCMRPEEGGAEESRAGASAPGASAAFLDSSGRRGCRGCRLMSRGGAASAGWKRKSGVGDGRRGGGIRRSRCRGAGGAPAGSSRRRGPRSAECRGRWRVGERGGRPKLACGPGCSPKSREGCRSTIRDSDCTQPLVQ